MLQYPTTIIEKKVNAKKENYEFGNYKCYVRYYFRYGWYGRYLDDENLDKEFFDRVSPIVNKIAEHIANRWENGCNYLMEDELKEIAYRCLNGRYLMEYSEDNFFFMIEFYTEFGNDDYPVRIYIYEKEN